MHSVKLPWWFRETRCLHRSACNHVLIGRSLRSSPYAFLIDAARCFKASLRDWADERAASLKHLLRTTPGDTMARCLSELGGRQDAVLFCSSGSTAWCGYPSLLTGVRDGEKQSLCWAPGCRVVLQRAESKGNRARLSFAKVSDTCLLRGSSVAGGGKEERSCPCLLWWPVGSGWWLVSNSPEVH